MCTNRMVITLVKCVCVYIYIAIYVWFNELLFCYFAEMPLKAAEIIVTCGFDQLFIKSIGKQQISAAAKSLLAKQQNKMLKGAENSKYLPLLAKAFINNHIVKVKKEADLRRISRCDIKKIKTF